MNSFSPAFGQADLTNCERELIHLAGSVQPHGVLLVVDPVDWRIVQVSANSAELIGFTPAQLLGGTLGRLGQPLLDAVQRRVADSVLAEPAALRCRLGPDEATARWFEGGVHRLPADAGGWLIIEIEPAHGPLAANSAALDAEGLSAPLVAYGERALLDHVGESVRRFSAVSTIAQLADEVARRLRDLLGYDRVMIYKFDPDGHGKIIAEARDARLESLLGHHYPATDIPQRARELYLRNRLRVLVDVNYQPALLEPAQLHGTELDMSMCYLRSMSPLHLQYLRNMGVTATLVASLVREGRLWGLIACHHYSTRNVSLPVRSATDLLAEVVSTRISAIENYVHAQVALQVRRLEQRLVEATSIEGDWRAALMRNPHAVLQPFDASGAVLSYDGELLTCGEVPSTPELRALARWVDERTRAPADSVYATASIGQDHPPLASLTLTASGVLAVRLSPTRADHLIWLRREQLQSVTWAGDPHKPMVGNDPLELSPRRSFAAWSEIVRGTALPWSGAELALARAFGHSLVDIIAQVNAVRLVIAEHQLRQTRDTVAGAAQAVVVLSAAQDSLFANAAWWQLAGRRPQPTLDLAGWSAMFTQPAHALALVRNLSDERSGWRGELALLRPGASDLPVAVRAEVVPGRDGKPLGYFMIFTDLSDSQRAAQARARLERALDLPAALDEVSADGRPADELIDSLMTNASLAAMDVADGDGSPAVVTLLDEINQSTQRATALVLRIRALMGGR